MKDWVMSKLRRLARRGILSRSAADREEQMEGYLTDPGEPEALDRVRRVQHYGFRSRPGAGAEIWCIAPEGGASQRVYVASEAPGEGPDDQAEWEVELYCHHGQRIRLTKDGDVIVLPKVGRKVKLGSDDDAQLDPVALYTQLKADYDALVSVYNNHTHVVSGTTSDVPPKNVTGTAAKTAASADPLSNAVASSNVVAKKP